MAEWNLTQAQVPLGMNFDTGDLNDMIVELDGLVRIAQSPQLPILTNSIQDLHTEPGESIVLLASKFELTPNRS